MPASTSIVQGRCFLAWNETGLVVKRMTDEGSAVEVEFSDSRRKRILFSDSSDIVLASLSSAGGVFGGVEEDEDGKTTGYVYLYSVYYLLFVKYLFLVILIIILVDSFSQSNILRVQNCPLSCIWFMDNACFLENKTAKRGAS